MATTEGLLVAVRAIHFAPTLALFGEIVFVLWTANRSSTPTADTAADEDAAGWRRRRRAVIAAWLVTVVSGVCWLLLQSALMSGRTPAQGWDGAVLASVVEDTLFGRAWTVRALLALALAAAVGIGSVDRGRQRRTLDMLAAILAGALVAGLAWAGHANMEGGADGAIHHLGDALHLLAAGAWWGGMAPLAAALRRLDDSPTEAALDCATHQVRRFGALAMACVAALLATGVVDARYTLRSTIALVETPYGHLLLLKLGLFAAMLALAAVNRACLTPRLAVRSADVSIRLAAARRLRRNACAEQRTGLAILVVVGMLGLSALSVVG